MQLVTDTICCYMPSELDCQALRRGVLRLKAKYSQLRAEDFFLLFSYSICECVSRSRSIPQLTRHVNSPDTALSDTCFLYYDCQSFEDGETYLVSPSVTSHRKTHRYRCNDNRYPTRRSSVLITTTWQPDFTPMLVLSSFQWASHSITFTNYGRGNTR